MHFNEENWRPDRRSIISAVVWQLRKSGKVQHETCMMTHEWWLKVNGLKILSLMIVTGPETIKWTVGSDGPKSGVLTDGPGVDVLIMRAVRMM